MGYKLAGFDVIGCNEIDPKVFAVYNANHNPKHAFVCSIRDMLSMDLPDEMFSLDILDGSPPCTSFSVAGVRDRDWGRTKKFNEGQAHQRLDDLFFEFIALAKRLQPKIVISENVTGIVMGKAKGYVKEIIGGLDDAGYHTQIFTLNAAQMGVPQARRRVFFLSRRKDLGLPRVRLKFNEKVISFSNACSTLAKPTEKCDLGPLQAKLWGRVNQGQQLSKAHPRKQMWNHTRVAAAKPVPTLPANAAAILHPTIPRMLSVDEWIACSSFPTDMKFPGANTPSKRKWFLGMSVPPFMVQRIALEVRKQWMGHA